MKWVRFMASKSKIIQNIHVVNLYAGCKNDGETPFKFIPLYRFYDSFRAKSEMPCLMYSSLKCWIPACYKQVLVQCGEELLLDFSLDINTSFQFC